MAAAPERRARQVLRVNPALTAPEWAEPGYPSFFPATVSTRYNGNGMAAVATRTTGTEVCLTLRDRSGCDSDRRERFWRGWWCS